MISIDINVYLFIIILHRRTTTIDLLTLADPIRVTVLRFDERTNSLSRDKTQDK